MRYLPFSGPQLSSRRQALGLDDPGMGNPNPSTAQLGNDINHDIIFSNPNDPAVRDRIDANQARQVEGTVNLRGHGGGMFEGYDSEAQNIGGLNRYRDQYDTLRQQGEGQSFASYWQNQAARGQTQTLADQLAAQSRGEGPSLAQMQLQAGADRNMADAMSVAASTRGNARFAAQRQVAQQRGTLGQQLAQQSAMTQLNEQMAARQQLAGVLANMRGQDLQSLGMGHNLQQAGLAGAVGLETNQTAMRMQQQDQMIRAWAAQNGFNLGQQQNNMQLLGAGAQTAGTLGAAWLNSQGGGNSGGGRQVPYGGGAPQTYEA